ncbi:MAG: hypothetical protein ACE5FD_12720, partial [Anaerolineae bacterium]
RYKPVGMPTFFWTDDGDNVLDNVDDSTYQNWGVMGGINGDVPPEVEWRIAPPTSTPATAYYLGRKAIEPGETLDPADMFYIEYQGTADANASAGQVESQTGTSLDFTSTIAGTNNIKQLYGRALYLARVTTDAATASATITPLYALDATNIEIVGDGVSVTLDATKLALAELGEMYLNWPFDTPDSITCGVRVTFASSDVARLDFLLMLPSPNCRLSVVGGAFAAASGDEIVLRNRDAYSMNGDTYKYRFEHRGDVIDFVPGKLNYVWLVQGADGADLDKTDQATVSIFVTPRYLLPGGPIS